MTISIVVATYSGSKCLAEQLESFNKKTLLPEEPIITDSFSIYETESFIITS